MSSIGQREFAASELPATAGATAGAASPAAVFWIGVLALFAAGASASSRAAIAADLKTAYLDRLDPAHSTTIIASALATAFLGFCGALVGTSLLLDRLGMRRMFLAASVCFVGGSALLMGCGAFGGGTATLAAIRAGMFVSGLAWGVTEGTINPMVASLYPDDTTHRMNVLHAWWPAGLVVGGLAGVFSAQAGLDWRIVFALVPLVGVIMGAFAWRQDFPVTTSARLGVDHRTQLAELFRRPSFFIWFTLMLFTAAAELAPGQWVDVSLTNIVGMRGVLLLVYVAVLQFVGRHFAGPLERRFSPEGLLGLSSLLACAGLLLLSRAWSPASAIAAATIWGVGVCFTWPTMIAVVAQRYPRGGALALGLMGVAGSISTYFVLPVLGAIYDGARLRAAGGAAALARLDEGDLQRVNVPAAGQSFQAVALIPAALVICFGLLWLRRRR
jgi:MFS family permease